KEALRCLKRHLARTVYRCLHTDQGTNQTHPKPDELAAA
ncbi:hypothetical protein M2272_003231, partial [Mycobacterium frederiksbergense]|nr:hypothetical protein [Mycolicibacterium frederiksbergense]